MKMGRSTFCSSLASPLLVLIMVVFSVSFASALQGDDEVTPEVQRLYAQASAAQQHGDSTTAIEKYRAMLKLAPHRL